MDKISLILVLAAVLFFAHVGEAVTCYDCIYSTYAETTDPDVRCMDPFDKNSGVPNITSCENGCVKATGKNTATGDIWVRSCNPVPLSECDKACEGDFGYTDCDCCNSDFCNGVGTIYDVSPLVTLCVSILAICVGHFK